MSRGISGRIPCVVSPLLLVGGGLLLLGASVAARVLSRMNARYIADLHPVARETFRAFVSRVERELGWQVRIISGFRTGDDQRIVRARGETATTTMRSAHNYGLAIDINCSRAGRVLRKGSSRAEWEASGIPQLARSMNLR